MTVSTAHAAGNSEPKLGHSDYPFFAIAPWISACEKRDPLLRRAPQQPRRVSWKLNGLGLLDGKKRS